MAKICGIRTIISTFQRLGTTENWTWLSPSTISEHTGISETRVKRILDRNTSLVRRSRGTREVYTLVPITM